MRHRHNLLTVLAVALGCACGPLTPEQANQVQAALFWTESQGNDLIYAANSNVELRLRVGQALTAKALSGNVLITPGRSGDTVSPSQASVPGSGEIGVDLRVGGPGAASVTAQLGAIKKSLELEVSTPDASASTLTFEPNTVVAGEQAALGTLWAKDSAGKDIAGVQAQVTSDDPNAYLQPSTLTTRNAGRDVFSVVGYRAGLHHFRVEGSGLTFSATLTVKPAGINSLSSSVVCTPAVTVANGVDRTGVRVQVVDAYNNPIAGVNIRLSAGSTTVTDPATGVTDADGRFESTLTSTASGVITVVAKAFPPSSSSVNIIGRTLFVPPT